jgi:hypothetical protein
MSLVYLFGISPTVAPVNFKIAISIRYALFLVKSIRHISSSLSVWMVVLDVPLFFISQSAVDSGLCDVVSFQRDFWDRLDHTIKSAVTFGT